MAKDQAENEATRLLTAVGLAEKMNQAPGNMSGGQKRRVSLALALIGNPKVVLLDEPTTGLGRLPFCVMRKCR